MMHIEKIVHETIFIVGVGTRRFGGLRITDPWYDPWCNQKEEMFRESDESVLERQLKKLERDIRKFPNRADLKLQAMDIRRQLKALKVK
jgi:hypothetical protein